MSNVLPSGCGVLAMLGEIGVGKLQAIGRAHEPMTELTVEPKPEDWNRAHAAIRELAHR